MALTACFEIAPVHHGELNSLGSVIREGVVCTLETLFLICGPTERVSKTSTIEVQGDAAEMRCVGGESMFDGHLLLYTTVNRIYSMATGAL